MNLPTVLNPFCDWGIPSFRVLLTEDRARKTHFPNMHLGSKFCPSDTAMQGEEAGTPGNHVKTRMRAEATGFGGSTGGGWVSMSLQLVSFSDYTSWAAAVGSLLRVPWGGLGIVSGPVASKPPSLVLLEISNILLQIYFRLK